MSVNKTKLAVLLRIFALIFTSVAIALTAAGSTVECKSDISYLDVSIKHWPYILNHVMKGKHIIGQYVAFATEITTAVLILIAVVYKEIRREQTRRWLERTLLIFAAALALAVAGLECWYATGFGLFHGCIIKAWALASGFLVLIGIILLLDVVFLISRPTLSSDREKLIEAE